MDPLRHLLSASYLFAQNSTPEGPITVPNVIWAVTLALIALATWTWGHRSTRVGIPAPRAIDRWWLMLSTCSAATGAALVLLRPLVTGALSARVWAVTCTASALLAPALGRLEGQLALCKDDVGDIDDLPQLWGWAALTAHAAGLYLLGIVADQGRWPIALALVCLVIASLTRQPRRLRLSILSPLLPVYALVIIVLLLQNVLRIDLGAYQAFPYPDHWSPWFDIPTLAVAGALGVVLATGVSLWKEGTAQRLSALFAITSALWFVASTTTHLTHGVTGSDPYCYLQMAADLVERGTLLHDFPILDTLRDAGIPAWPGVHVGYQVLGRADLAPTVWPMGWPVLLTPLYRTVGEPGILIAAPLWALLGGLLTWLTATTLCHHWPLESRFTAAGCAAVVILTSSEAFLRSLVPLADAAAQALAVLTLLLLVRTHREENTRRAIAWCAAAGLAFGLAYLVRHPQLMLGAGVIPLVVGRHRSGRRRALGLTAFATAALLVALPDLAYHNRVFGSPFRSESPEWFLISPGHIPEGAKRMANALFSRREFGYIAPLTAIGWLFQWKASSQRPVRLAMNLSFATVLFFSLSYEAIRLRDLISLFPWLAIWTGEGLAILLDWLTRARPLLRSTALALIVMAMAARATWFLGLPWYRQVPTFGLVNEEQRAEFVGLRAILPDDAIVFTALNSGAVERYSGATTVRPSSLSRDEFERLLQAVDPITIFVLEDGEEMRAFVAYLEERGDYRLLPIASLDLPCMGLGGQPIDGPARLYVLDTNPK